MKDIRELIGKQVIYYDYLGSERNGRVVGIEPSNNPEEPWIYIEDEEVELNIHHEQLLSGEFVVYAELRPSSEVVLDDK